MSCVLGAIADVFDQAQYDPQPTEGDWVERLREKLTESVKLRMVSDAPFGVFPFGRDRSNGQHGAHGGADGSPGASPIG